VKVSGGCRLKLSQQFFLELNIEFLSQMGRTRIAPHMKITTPSSKCLTISQELMSILQEILVATKN